MKLFNRMVLVAILLLFHESISVYGGLSSSLTSSKSHQGNVVVKRQLHKRRFSVSSSSVQSLPTVSSTVMSEVLSRVPTILDDERKLSLVDLSSPAFRSVEDVIEYYEQSQSTFVSYFEEAARTPSIVSSPSFYAQLISVYPTLDSAVRELNYVERSHPSVTIFQPELQSLMRTYSSVVTQLEAETRSSSSSLASAGSEIKKAELTVPNLLTDVIDVEAIAIEFPAVSDAIHEIGSYIFSAPSSVGQMVTELLQSPSSSISTSAWSSYTTILNAAKSLAMVLEQSQSMRSPIVQLVHAAESVAQVLNAVDAELSYHDKTLEVDLSYLSALEHSWPPITAAVEWLDILEASNPSLSHALTVIEASVYLSARTAQNIISALRSPSLVTDWSSVSIAEMSHESLVSAVETLLGVESEHSSIASTMHLVTYKIFELESHDRTLLTAMQAIIGDTNPEFAIAAVGIQTVAVVEPDVAQALSYFNKEVRRYPSLECDEQLVAYYDEYVPSVVKVLRDAIASPSTVSSLSYFRSMEASYSRLMSVLRSIYSAEKVTSSLSSVLSQVNYALVYDPSVTKQWSEISSLEDTLTSDVNYLPPSARSPTCSQSSSSS